MIAIPTNRPKIAPIRNTGTKMPAGIGKLKHRIVIKVREKKEIRRPTRGGIAGKAVISASSPVVSKSLASEKTLNPLVEYAPVK